MAIEPINVGTEPNSHEGDSLRKAFQKTNNNITELYNMIVGNPVVTVPISSIGEATDVIGSIAADETYLYYCTTAYDGSTDIWKRIAWSGEAW